MLEVKVRLRFRLWYVFRLWRLQRALSRFSVDVTALNRGETLRLEGVRAREAFVHEWQAPLVSRNHDLCAVACLFSTPFTAQASPYLKIR